MMTLLMGKGNQSITQKLVFLVVLLGVSVMLVGATARFMLFRIETEQQLIKQADLIASFVKKPVKEAISRGNKAYLSSLLKDITDHDFIYRVALSYEYDGISVSISEVTQNRKRYTHRLDDFQELEKSFNIIAGDNSAYLTIFSRHELFSPETTTKLVYNLIFEACIIFVITLGVLLFLKRLVIRHLEKISGFARNMSLENLSNKLVLDRIKSNIKVRDELDHVVEAIEHMRQSLIEDLDKRHSIERALIAEKEEKLQHKRLIEEAKASSMAKSQFIATMSHEIRTPMNGIIGMVEMLKVTPLSDIQQNYIGVIHSSGESLLSIINAILDYSKIEDGKMSLENINFNLEHIISSCLHLFSGEAKKRNIEFVSNISSNTPTRLMGDPTRLRQILINLIGNAFKFITHNQGYVFVDVHIISEPNSWQPIIHFSVRDSGIGIEESAHVKLFEAFQQADSGTTRKFGGTGLGLAICRELVRMMGGNIGLSSEVNVGSTFWFTAKFLYPKQNFIEEKKKKYLELAHKKLLYVHSETFMNDSLRAHCKSVQMELVVCHSAVAALEMLGQGKSVFDFIVLNDIIGSIKGLIVASQIHEIDAMRTTPIFLLTNEQKISYLSDEFIHVATPIQRPLNMRDFIDVLAQHAQSYAIDEKPKTIETEQEKQKQNQKLNVLVAEDNLINRMVIEGLLKRFDMYPDFCENGVETVTQLTSSVKTYDVIFMDCEMPEMDGFEATLRIREWEAEKAIKPIPIIALTAHVESSHRQKVFQVGMNYYLSKPITLEKLRESLENINLM